MKFEKLGHIFVAEKQNDWLYTHAMVPIARHLSGDRYRIFFSSRDKHNRGHGGFVEIDMKDPLKVLAVSERPVLVPGDLGCFDDSGALPNCLVTVKGEEWLYYTGINLGVTVGIRNSIGLARWNPDSQVFDKVFKGPLIDRTRDHPHFVAMPEVHHDKGAFRAWFVSCVRWEKTDAEPRHFYNLEYAESDNGIDWKRPGTRAIDFADQYEYALAGPRVLKDEDRYRMWFCSRASREVGTYRIRYAESDDGIHWARKDDQAGIDVSSSGWDSEMLCYPHVFDHGGSRYMLYNGNGYGRTGFGIAKLEA